MRVILLLVFILLAPAFAEASKGEFVDGYLLSEWADAIYKAEGGKRAKKPYGILSIPCNSEPQCRRYCLNTVRNNWVRWLNYTHGSDRFDTFIEFLGSRYAPPSAHSLNKHWVPNVRALLK